MIEPVNSKYFKLSVGKLKKDTPDEISCCCPACGDTKNRLHLYHTEVGDLVHCFNSSCELEEKHHTVLNFLKIINSMYVSAYKRSTLKNTIEDLKNTTSLSDILARVKEKESTPDQPAETTKEIPLQKMFRKCTDSEECLEYLTTRHILPRSDWFFSTQKFFKYQEKNVFLENYLLIPIYNKELKYRGFYSRSIKEKRFSTFLLDDTEKVWVNHPNEQPSHIGEGIFDMISFDCENPAAMLGASISDAYLNALPKDVIFVMDNDSTGIKKSIQYAEKGFRIFVWPSYLDNFKDINSLLDKYNRDETTEIVQNNIFSGMKAIVRLRMKSH